MFKAFTVAYILQQNSSKLAVTPNALHLIRAINMHTSPTRHVVFLITSVNLVFVSFTSTGRVQMWGQAYKTEARFLTVIINNAA